MCCWPSPFSSSFLLVCCVLRDDPRLFCHWKFIDENENLLQVNSSFGNRENVWYNMYGAGYGSALYSSSSSDSHYCTSHHPSLLQAILQEQVDKVGEDGQHCIRSRPKRRYI